MNKVLDKLPALIDEELQAAIDEHGDFHSFHEGYAVLLEEVEECKDEFDNVRNLTELMWLHLRANDVEGVLCRAEGILKYAQKAAAEAIQVAAMAQKIISYGDAS